MHPEDPRQTTPDQAAGITADRELLALLRSALLGGRWILFAAELAVALLHAPRLQESTAAGAALALLCVFNAVTLVALKRLPPDRAPVPLLLIADVLTVGVLVGLTGGMRSPFASLYFLIILLGAIHFDLAGSMGVAAAAVGVLLATSMGSPTFSEDVWTGSVRTQLVPYLLLHGAAAGQLVRLLKRLHARRIEFEERLRRAELDERLRQHEAEVARSIQRAAFVEGPCHPVFETAVRFEPAREVGGDFFSFFTEGPRLGVVLGDVCGKGVPAALTATSLCHLIHWLRPMEDPRSLLPELNRYMVERLPEGTFATAVFAIIDPVTECLTLYTAGHLPSLLLRNGRVGCAEFPNLPLGVDRDACFSPHFVPFRGGDTLLLYSDGVVETRNAAGEELEIAGLRSLALRHAGLPADALADALVAETHAFGSVRDDLTLVVVRTSAPAAAEQRGRGWARDAPAPPETPPRFAIPIPPGLPLPAPGSRTAQRPSRRR